MEFLKLVATQLCRRYGNNLSRVAVVFPNKRASLFFNDYLLALNNDRPIWAPRYFTISEIFDSLSQFRRVDPIKAVCRLFEIYKRETADLPRRQDKELLLDYFYGWGQQLLSDFSDIDACLADVDQLFDSITAIKELEKLGPEMIARLEPLVRLLTSPDEAGSLLKEDFIALWGKLKAIYRQFNARLSEEGEAYVGAIQRDAVQRLSADAVQLPGRYATYVFVGFNLLQPSERRLFSLMKERVETLFFWDYDVLYVGPEARIPFGDDLLQNLRQFDNAITDQAQFDNFSHRPPIRYITAQSDRAQTYYAGQWLDHLKAQGVAEEEMAVVLCNEGMIEPVLHSIPSKVKNINITKGFPLNHTPAYLYLSKKLNRLLEGLRRRPDEAPCPLDFVRQLAQDIERRALRDLQTPTAQAWIGQLNKEAYFECYTTVMRFADYIERQVLNVQLETLVRLLRQVLGEQSIPFHGEPLGGVQIMGMLETRNLDFRHILLLGVEEGTVPHTSPDRSFIPYDLRKYYRILTNDERVKVYAYNFFRLLGRSANVTLVYNGSTDGDKHSGEMSRFMTQILAQTDIPVQSYILQEDMETVSCRPMAQPHGRLLADQPLRFSPSGLGEYVRCPMRYFFSHVAHFDNPDTAAARTFLPANTFGSIYHDAVEHLYKPYLGRPITTATLQQLHDDDLLIDRLVCEAFQHVSQIDAERQKIPADAPQLYLPDEHQAERRVICRYVKALLSYDLHLAKDGLVISATEQKIEVPLTPNCQLVGTIDRVDHCAGQLRIVDYKSGHYDAQKLSAKTLDEVFTQPDKGYVLQTLIYQLMFQLDREQLADVALYYMSKLVDKDYNPYVKLPDELLSETPAQRIVLFRQALQDFIGRIVQQPFTPTDDSKRCEACPYNILC